MKRGTVIILFTLLRLISFESIPLVQAESGQSLPRQTSTNFDLSRLLSFGLGPAGGAMNYLLPNTMQGLSSDLSNGYNSVSSFPSSGLNAIQSSYQAASNNALNRYNKLQSQFNDGYLTTNQLLFELYQMLRNPEEICKNLSLQSEALIQNGQNLSQQTKQAMDKAGQLLDGSQLGNLGSSLMNSQKQVTQQAVQSGAPGSLMNKLSGGFMGK